MSEDQPVISYLNTDLDLCASCDLSPLASALKACGVQPLHVTLNDNKWFSILETYEQQLEPEGTIRIMLDAIEALDGEAKEIWTQCSLREFNIGYDCGDEPWAFNNGLTHSTLKRMSNAGASLRITLYPFRPTPQ